LFGTGKNGRQALSEIAAKNCTEIREKEQEIKSYYPTRPSVKKKLIAGFRFFFYQPG
jgi:hypothetical protein